MKIQLIGTGSIGATQSSASTLIDDKVLIDMPNGNVKKMKQMGINVSNIKVILITHLHGDHFVDLIFYMFDKSFYNPDQEVKIYCPAGTESKVRDISEIIFPGAYENNFTNINIKFIEFDKLENEEILENIFVTSILVEHGDIKPAYGYIISKNNKKVGLSGDSKLCSGIKQIVESSNISILDMSMPEDGNDSHMGLNDIENLCNEYKDKKIIPTHMRDFSRESAIKRNIENLIVLNDGEIVNIE